VDFKYNYSDICQIVVLNALSYSKERAFLFNEKGPIAFLVYFLPSNDMPSILSITGQVLRDVLT